MDPAVVAAAPLHPAPLRQDPVTLSLDLVRLMGLVAVHEPPGAAGIDERCNGLSFSNAGDYFASSHNDGTLNLFSAATGAKEHEVHVRDQGCRLVTMTHHHLSVLHAASKGAVDTLGQVSYHSLHDNTIVRTFRGHTDFVTFISMNPVDDTFLTTSRDGTFRVWDLRQPKCVAAGETGAKGVGVAAFDCAGMVFAVASPARMISLWDVKRMACFSRTTEPLLQQTVTPGSYPGRAVAGLALDPQTAAAGQAAAAAAAAARLPPYPPTVGWTGLEFSPDDRYIALSTADRGVLVLDAFFPGRELALLQAHPLDPVHPSNISWSPDGHFLATGSVDGHVWVYDLSGKPPETKIGAEESSTLPPLPYHPQRWRPPAAILGEGFKTGAAVAAAHAAAAAHLPEVHRQLHGRFGEAAARGPPDAPLHVQLPALPVPGAGGADEQVSRHEGPVRVVRWHPRGAALASGSQAVGLWVPLMRGVAEYAPVLPPAADAAAADAPGAAGCAGGAAAAAGSGFGGFVSMSSGGAGAGTGGDAVAQVAQSLS